MADEGERLTIYTDGGADPNPGAGGWGAVCIHADGSIEELSGGEPDTTNNRMELSAAIGALDSLPRPASIDLYTDSRYVKQGITEWLAGWRARGWQRKGGAVKNVDLWQRLSAATDRHDVAWHWVKGHAGHEHNERADALATAAIRQQQRKLSNTSGKTWHVSSGEPPEIEIFQRVSCARGRGGWAALIRHGGEDETVMGVRKKTTSNQLDLLAACGTLERLPKGVTVAVYTVSDYLRNGATMWIQGWRKRGWKTKSGDPVANRELWERLDVELQERRVTWPSFKGDEPEELEALEMMVKSALHA